MYNDCIDRTYPPRGPHDIACNRVPQRFRKGHWLGYGAGVEPVEGFRPCPLRSDKELFPGEGSHATTWLAVRGHTVRLLGPWWHIAPGRYVHASGHDQAERIRCGR